MGSPNKHGIKTRSTCTNDNLAVLNVIENLKNSLNSKFDGLKEHFLKEVNELRVEVDNKILNIQKSTSSKLNNLKQKILNVNNIDTNRKKSLELK